MIRTFQLRISLKEAAVEGILTTKAAKHVGADEKDIMVKVLRKSIDARKPKIYFNYKLEVYIREKPSEARTYTFDYKEVAKAKEIILSVLVLQVCGLPCDV